MSDVVFEFTDQNFEKDVLQSDVPVLIDFGQLGVVRARLLRR